MSIEVSNNGQNHDENTPEKNDEQSMNILDYENIITTPYEKVLSVINDAVNFVKLNSKSSNDNKKLIDGLEWVIKVITSHSLYAYELKETPLINQISEQNPEFKKLVDFISKYNHNHMQKHYKIVKHSKILISQYFFKGNSIIKLLEPVFSFNFIN